MLINSKNTNGFDFWDEKKSYDQFLWTYYTIEEMIGYL